MIERERIIEALKEVRHPAMQDRDIVDLGLVADIECGEDKVVVTLGFPKRRDPLTEYLVGATRASLVRHLPSSVSTEVKAVVKENNSDYGQYADADGKLVTCFLTNLDITGGNSGSPVLDADGNLIGLAFDGNWEAMSGDVIFEPELQRCICVDIRYVLLLVDKWGGAGYLLNEMNIVK